MNNNIEINKSNYESYVIDYLDGKLNAIDNANFIAFLEKHPDIQEEMADLERMTLNPEIKEFTQKNKLKKAPFFSINNINEINYEEYFIAFYEGDLSESEKRDLQNILSKNPYLVSEFEAFKRLRVVPDTDIVFVNKSLLRHKNNMVPIWISAAAAVIILFAASWLFFIQQSNVLKHELYGISEIIPKVDHSKLSLSTNTKVEFNERQFVEIIPIDNSSELTSYNEISISTLSSKINDEQLVNVFDFARLSKHRVINIESPYNQNVDMMASAEFKTKKPNQSLIAKIFNSQKDRLANIINYRRSKKVKSTDPTYIQVIDKSLLVFNTITGSETERVKTYNTNGELTSFQVEGKEVLLGRRNTAKSAQ